MECTVLKKIDGNLRSFVAHVIIKKRQMNQTSEEKQQQQKPPYTFEICIVESCGEICFHQDTNTKNKTGI